MMETVAPHGSRAGRDGETLVSKADANHSRLQFLNHFWNLSAVSTAPGKFSSTDGFLRYRAHIKVCNRWLKQVDLVLLQDGSIFIS